MSSFFKTFLVSAFFWILIPAASASAATIYVNSSSGDDSTGAGSAGSPYRSFYKGYTSASSGDTIDLTGTFTWTDAVELGDTTTTGYILSKNLTIQGQGMDSTIVQASSTPNTADRAVFYISSGYTVTMKRMTIRHGVSNSTGNRGGGISNIGTLTLQNVDVSYNKYNSTNYYGSGGVFADTNASLTITTSTIHHNTFVGRYYGSGGVYAVQNVPMVLDYVTIHSNSSTSDNPNTFAFSYAAPSGGLGTFRFGAIRMTNCTVSENSTNSYGGGMQIYYKDSTKFTNITVANNTSTYGAGGILYQSEWDGYTLYLKNSILANNTAAGSANDFHAYDASSASRVTSNGYNIVEYSTNKTFAATGDVTGNQASLNLASAVATNDASHGIQTLALSSGSVAIDAGNSTANASIAVPSVDQRGASRSGTTDIGAYEYGGGGLGVTYVVSYSAGFGGSISGSSTQIVNSGSNAAAVTAVPSTGHYFLSWSDASTTNPRTEYAVTSATSVSATFATSSYAVVYSAGFGGSISGSSTQSVSYGSDTASVTAVPSTGHYFVSWSDASTTNPRVDYSIASATTVTATFATSSYAVTYTAGTGGTLTGSSTQLVSYGSNAASVTAVASSGYQFLQWSDASATNPRTDYITSTTTILAVFTVATSTDSGGSDGSGGGGGFTPPPGIGSGTSEMTVAMDQVGDAGLIKEEGKNILAYAQSQIGFHLSGSNFGKSIKGIVIISNVDLLTNRVTLDIQPGSLKRIFVKGQSMTLDLDKDGVADLEIIFADVWVNRVELTLRRLLPKAAVLVSAAPVKPKVLGVSQTRACPEAFKRDLKLGSRGKDVMVLQRCLKAIGYPVRLPDGSILDAETTYFGPSTHAAVIRLQKAKKLTAKGLLGPQTRKLLQTWMKP